MRSFFIEVKTYVSEVYVWESNKKLKNHTVMFPDLKRKEKYILIQVVAELTFILSFRGDPITFEFTRLQLLLWTKV